MKKITKGERAIPKNKFSEIRKLIPILTVDGVIFLKEKVLLVKRSITPYKGYWCLPGGHVRFGETVEEAVIREVGEETGLEVEIEKMIGVYSSPKRDPRGHSVTIAYLLKALGGGLRPDKSEASDIGFFENLPKKIGFDHMNIIRDAKSLARNLKT